ncbi:MAG TPA: HAMP domain-containing sensor histidine kinase [Caulobacteraceae bacterium]
MARPDADRVFAPIAGDAGREAAVRSEGQRRATVPRGLGRLLARTGTRLALLQATAVMLAFAVAGYSSHVEIDRIHSGHMRKTILGEMVSLEVEYRQFGSDHLPATVARRTRLWRGFDYRWTSADGARAVGLLPPAADGWSIAHRDEPGVGGRIGGFLVFSERLPDGSKLEVGQNLADGRSETVAVTQALVTSGALGVAFCLAASYLFSRGAWRRIEDLVRSAKAVAGGQLDARVRLRSGDSPDDLDELAHAFNVMLDRIGELLAQVRQVSSDVAHDLRTPLTRVRQRLDRLGQGLEAPAAERLESIGRIQADLDEVLSTFSALLRLAEIENDERAATTAPVDLAEVVQRIAETYRPDITSTGRTLTVDAEPAVICGDAQLITQAIANLIDNILHHTPPGTPVMMSARVEKGVATLSITDRGPGVPAEYRDLVLQRCRRLDPSRPGSGAGLGLAIVAAIARRHGAKLVLGDAKPGLVVTMTFPHAPTSAVR